MIEGVIAIPVSVVTVLAMLLPKRPPWTTRQGRIVAEE